MRLLVDVNGMRSACDATRALARVAEIGLELIEQPLPIAAAQSQRDLVSHCTVDIAADESVRCVTDAANHSEGLYLDDITPVPRYGGVQMTDTASPDTIAALQPIPTQPVWLQVRGWDGEGQPSYWSERVYFSPSVAGVAVVEAPRADRLSGIAPNPANPSAEVRFTLAAGRASVWRLDCFDVSGRWMGRVAEGRDLGAGGALRSAWSGKDRAGRDLPSGVYFLRLTHGAVMTNAKVALVR